MSKQSSNYLDNSENFDSEKLFTYLREANDKIHKKINNNDIVLVIGNTGAGISIIMKYFIYNLI